MGSIMRIFDVFSKRPEASAKPVHEVPRSTRNRVLMWCTEIYRGSRLEMSSRDYNPEFWHEVYRRFRLRTGSLALGESRYSEDFFEAYKYVQGCPGEQFLDFLEDVFSVEWFSQVSDNDKKLVDELNALLRLDRLPYHVTYFVKETGNDGGRFGGQTVTYIRATPKVIMKESETLHTTAIEPVLTLLQGPHFRNANSEYLAALEDYRKGDIGDCLTKCGSAFESVLKVICDRKGWSYKQTDTAGTLVKTVLSNTKLDTYFEPLLLIVATLRNKLSSSHGAGTTAKQPARHLAQYALNATASAILLVAQETGEA